MTTVTVLVPEGLTAEKLFARLRTSDDEAKLQKGLGRYAESVCHNLKTFSLPIRIFDHKDRICFNIGNSVISGLATELDVLLSKDDDYVCFYSIRVANKKRHKGLGGALVDAVLREIPQGAYIRVHHDGSGGFWEHLRDKYNGYEWNLW
jgi:hypothetical protein